MSNFFVFDTETTGFRGSPYLTNPNIRIVQLSAAQLHGEATFDAVVNPEVHIPSPSTEIHGITNEAAAGAALWPEVFRQFLAFLRGAAASRKRKCVSTPPTIFLIAHNARFDLSMLRQMGALYGTEIPDNVVFLDTLPFFKANFPELLQREPASRPFNLGNLYEYAFGEPLEGAHNALADVRGLKRLILAVDAPFTEGSANHLKSTLDGNRSLMDIRGIGKARAMNIERCLQQHRYKPGGQRTVRDLRRYFAKTKPAEIESFLRYEIKIRDDDQVLEVMAEIMDRPITEVRSFPHIVSTKVGIDGLKCDSDLVAMYFYTLREDGDRLLLYLGEHMDERAARRVVNRYINRI